MSARTCRSSTPASGSRGATGRERSVGSRFPITVDSAVPSPYAGSMDLHVPPELEAKLNRLAAGTGRDAEQVALDLLANSLEHDDGSGVKWRRAESPHMRGGYSIARSSWPESNSAIVPDARPLDD